MNTWAESELGPNARVDWFPLQASRARLRTSTGRTWSCTSRSPDPSTRATRSATSAPTASSSPRLIGSRATPSRAPRTRRRRGRRMRTKTRRCPRANVRCLRVCVCMHMCVCVCVCVCNVTVQCARGMRALTSGATCCRLCLFGLQDGDSNLRADVCACACVCVCACVCDTERGVHVCAWLMN